MIILASPDTSPQRAMEICDRFGPNRRGRLPTTLANTVHQANASGKRYKHRALAVQTYIGCGTSLATKSDGENFVGTTWALHRLAVAYQKPSLVIADYSHHYSQFRIRGELLLLL